LEPSIHPPFVARSRWLVGVFSLGLHGFAKLLLAPS
jgi:hypothetical protein